MESLIVAGILLVLVGAAVVYMWKERKKGTRCMGCPSAGCCSGNGCGNEKNGMDCDRENAFFIESTK